MINMNSKAFTFKRESEFMSDNREYGVSFLGGKGKGHWHRCYLLKVHQQDKG